ncbi:MAG: GIY-YIG nuclease family protein [Ignavibacteriales bacterium]|nr:GIY-YIG nuclease family protein [Ignavibacteriales bacterium]
MFILQSLSDGTYYTGFTNDLERRLKEHNSGHTVTTSKHKPWKIVYSEKAATLAEARKRELYLKSAAGRRYREKILLGKPLSRYLPG